MVAPVTGPFERLEGSIGTGARFIRHRVWYRQKKPYTLMLSYTKREGYCLDAANWRAMQLQQAEGLLYSYAASTYVEASSKAYAKLLGDLDVAEKSGLGVTLAQYRQAGDLMSTNLNRLDNFTRFLQIRNPSGVARSLSIPLKVAKSMLISKHFVRDKRYRLTKTTSDLWLEFWFGVKPLVSDIHNAIGVFEQPVPPARISGQVTIPSRHVYNNWGGPSEPRWVANVKVKCRQGCQVYVDNPNLRLAEQLGLLNLGVIGWDAMPWSFVVDWGFGVNAWLSSFTDFSGLRIENPYTTRTESATFNVRWSDGTYVGTTEFSRKVRSGTLTLPKPYWKFKGFKLTRAITAASLLGQRLAAIGDSPETRKQIASWDPSITLKQKIREWRKRP